MAPIILKDYFFGGGGGVLLGAGGLLPRSVPEGLPVVLGALAGFVMMFI